MICFEAGVASFIRNICIFTPFTYQFATLGILIYFEKEEFEEDREVNKCDASGTCLSLTSCADLHVFLLFDDSTDCRIDFD